MLAFSDALGLFQLISNLLVQPFIKWLKVKGDLPASILNLFNLRDRGLNLPDILVDVVSCMGFRFFIPHSTDSYTWYKANKFLFIVSTAAQQQNIQQELVIT